MPLDRGDLRDDHAAELRAHRLVRLDFDARHRQPLRNLRAAERRVAEAAQPPLGNVHANCARKRRSPSKKSRRSSMPCRSIVRRSRPEPKAKPIQRSGSKPKFFTTVGWTWPAPEISSQLPFSFMSISAEGSVNGK